MPDELKGRAEMKGEASMRGHLSAEGAEQTGSQSYVPPDEKDDKALAAAYNLLRGVTVNAGVPSPPKAAVSELKTSTSAANYALPIQPCAVDGRGLRGAANRICSDLGGRLRPR